MMDCYEEGNALLGKYEAKVVSVHDPDEYLAAATDDANRARREGDILEAYRALAELKEAGKVLSIGVGAKDITCIDWLCEHVQVRVICVYHGRRVVSIPPFSSWPTDLDRPRPT